MVTGAQDSVGEAGHRAACWAPEDAHSLTPLSLTAGTLRACREHVSCFGSDRAL